VTAEARQAPAQRLRIDCIVVLSRRDIIPMQCLKESRNVLYLCLSVCLFPTLIVGIDIGFVTCFFPFFPGSFFWHV
jgi:hypothetical protein